MENGGLNAKGIFMRLAFSLALVYATFNPEGLSFFDWAVRPLFQGDLTAARAQAPLKVLVALLLIGLWTFFSPHDAPIDRMGWRALGARDRGGDRMAPDRLAPGSAVEQPRDHSPGTRRARDRADDRHVVVPLEPPAFGTGRHRRDQVNPAPPQLS
jgi:hypothetical protein